MGISEAARQIKKLIKDATANNRVNEIDIADIESVLAEDDMRNIGEAFMEAISKYQPDAMYDYCPTELYVQAVGKVDDLQNEVRSLKRLLTLKENSISRIIERRVHGTIPRGMWHHYAEIDTYGHCGFCNEWLVQMEIKYALVNVWGVVHDVLCCADCYEKNNGISRDELDLHPAFKSEKIGEEVK